MTPWRETLCVSALSAVLLASCAGGSAPPLGVDHPANPRAPETPTAPQAATSATAQGYACPMHPDVTSLTPGTCPRCGMKLAPVTRSDAHPEGHR